LAMTRKRSKACAGNTSYKRADPFYFFQFGRINTID
jgi:hypothetical protein